MRMSEIVSQIAKQAIEVGQSDFRRFGAKQNEARWRAARQALYSGRPLAIHCESFKAAQAERDRFESVELPAGTVVKQSSNIVVVSPLTWAVGEALEDLPTELKSLVVAWADSITENAYRQGFLDGARRNGEPGDGKQIEAAVETPLSDFEKRGAHNGEIKLADALKWRRRAREDAEKCLADGVMVQALLSIS